MLVLELLDLLIALSFLWTLVVCVRILIDPTQAPKLPIFPRDLTRETLRSGPLRWYVRIVAVAVLIMVVHFLRRIWSSSGLLGSVR